MAESDALIGQTISQRPRRSCDRDLRRHKRNSTLSYRFLGREVIVFGRNWKQPKTREQVLEGLTLAFGYGVFVPNDLKPQPDPVGQLPIRLSAVSDARIDRRMMWRAGCSGARSEFVYLAVLLESFSHGHRLGARSNVTS
jgi:hypothetical protein